MTVRSPTNNYAFQSAQRELTHHKDPDPGDAQETAGDHTGNSQSHSADYQDRAGQCERKSDKFELAGVSHQNFASHEAADQKHHEAGN